MYVDETVYEGRPQDGLSEVEKTAYDLLDGLGIPYTRARHDEAHTIKDCEQVENLLGVKICKNLFLTNAQKTAFFMLVMPGDKPFKTKDLSRQINSARLSFAGPEDMMELLGITPGSVSVLALQNDKDKRVRLLIDKDVLKEEYFGCHPCRNTASLKIKTKDIMEKALPTTGHAPEMVALSSE